jgi:Tol biopolymer transport system component
MPLTAGTRLGAYEVVAKVGEGGMGEVYRARDAKLGREVAIKVLPASVATDPERLARFEREAQAVASLSHPNIIAVFEFGAHEGQPFVVMELLEGESLRERLAGGPLPVRKAVEIATQIARGLAAAHEKNLIHRDLKPENVFLLADGQVKILDFGLAKAMEPAAGGSGATETIARTSPGTVLGTVGYMAPEQIKGGAVDARTDLFALGLILHEMLGGARTFSRDTAAEVMTAILREDPPPLQRADLPPALDRVIQHALEKNPAERFQTARDVVFALSGTSGSTGASGTAPGAVNAAVTPRAPSNRAVLFGGAVAAMALAGAAGWWWGSRGASGAETRWELYTQLTDSAGEESTPQISPDGNSFAYASRSGGSWDVYSQRLGGRKPVLVAGDPVRHEMWPAFSPDGRTLAFNEVDADGGVFITGATGESERRLTEFGNNPAWAPDGKTLVFASEMVFSPYSRLGVSTLWVVDVAGGAPPRKLHGEDAVQPAWSPSGRRIAFWANPNGQRDLLTIAADGTDRVALTNDEALDWAPVWSPDGRYIYFASDRGGSMGLWRIAIDEATGRARREPESVAAGVEASMDLPSFSADGLTLLFRSRLQSVNPVSMPFDPVTLRAGEPRLLLRRTGILSPSSVSSDGQWLALQNMGEKQEDLFLMRTDGTDLRRVTDDAARDRMPRFTPDGSALTFYSNRGGRYSSWSVRPDGSGLTEIASSPTAELQYSTISPTDGRLLLADGYGGGFFARPPFPAAHDRLERIPNTKVSGMELNPIFWSPDGRLVSGVMVAPSGAAAGVGIHDVAARETRILTRDGEVWNPMFLPDSKRILYFTIANELIVVDIATAARRVLPVRLPFSVASESTTITTDGRTLYFGADQIEANVWMVRRRQ